MAKVIGTKGNVVQVEIKGIAETIDYLRKTGKEIKTSTDVGLLQASNFIQQELQESITGNRAEPRSVDTGKLANSIQIDKVGEGEFVIYPRKISYPGTDTTTEDVAKLLEYGTIDIAPRMHFRNTVARNKEKAKEIINNAIKTFK